MTNIISIPEPEALSTATNMTIELAVENKISAAIKEVEEMIEDANEAILTAESYGTYGDVMRERRSQDGMERVLRIFKKAVEK